MGESRIRTLSYLFEFIVLNIKILKNRYLYLLWGVLKLLFLNKIKSFIKVKNIFININKFSSL